MRKPFSRARSPDRDRSTDPQREEELLLPRPSPGFRRRAWLEFQRALDPLARPKPLRLRRRS